MLKKAEDKIVCRFCKRTITEGIYTTIDISSGNYLVICDSCKVKLALCLDQLTDGD